MGKLKTQLWLTGNPHRKKLTQATLIAIEEIAQPNLNKVLLLILHATQQSKKMKMAVHYSTASLLTSDYTLYYIIYHLS